MKKLYIIFICLALSTSALAYDNSHNRTGVDVDDAVERALVPRTDIRDESIASDNQLPTEKAVARAINLIPNTADIDHIPTSTDDENADYLVGDVVRNTSDNNRLYMCKSNLANNAVWQEIGGVASESDPVFVASPAHSITDSGSNQVITSTERTKLDGIENNATANSTDAVLLSRVNHTGTQTASTISDFDTEVSNNTDVTANTSHRGDTNNPHNTNKTHVGLGNVDNTSDADKPVSTATQTALDGKVDNTGNETIAGVKTFSSFPVTPSSAPTSDYQVANKKYVDDNVGGSGTDTNAIHDNVANEISAITEKASPASTDILIIEDSADSNNKKRVQIGNLPSSSDNVSNSGTPTSGQIAEWTDATHIQGVSSISVELTGFSNSMAVVSDGTGKLESDANVSAAELGYLNGVTSAIQTQIDGKEDSLGNPASDGYVLSSTAAGVRSWVANGSDGGAPTDAHYYVNLANDPLSAEVVVTGLETVNGLGKANGSGAWSVATDGTDYWSPASDGSGSGLDADTMDGHDTSYFQTDLTDSASLRNALSDETGSGAAVFAGGDIGAATATTPAAGDDGTSVATTAFVKNQEHTECVVVENLAAADDNYEIWMANAAVTITAIGVHCRGTCTTTAQISLEDRAGNAMTHTTPTASTGTGDTMFQNVTAANALVAGEGLAFDVDNAVSPETDVYTICFTYTY